jgi:predicted nucleic acid-binding protein
MSVSFIDANVLVYLASGDAAKADRAEEVVAGGGVVSVQVLNELANVAQRKMQISWEEVAEWLVELRRLLTVVPLTVESHVRGIAVAQRYQLSVYDGMIVGSALEAGCNILWTEDLQSGMVMDGSLRVENPFAKQGPQPTR